MEKSDNSKKDNSKKDNNDNNDNSKKDNNDNNDNSMGLLLDVLTVNTRVHRETAKNLCRMKVCLDVQTGQIELKGK
jgi:hypothetical protein